jgi:hypothetical protein
MNMKDLSIANIVKKNTKETYDSPESNTTTNIPRHEHE